ncbi:MAG: 50S ribosomal protein L11 methyltransferase [Lachnospiraceae bacterium]|nr:50S ribosomal protein L11 methyltransferase [Lachnospiraceae bacterium]
MKWTKIWMDTTTEAMDLVVNLFVECGLEGVQIEDNVPLTKEEREAFFVDADELMPDLSADDGSCRVSSYVDEEADVSQIKRDLEEGFSSVAEFVDAGSGEVFVETVDDSQWLNNWKEYFKPFYAAEGIYIQPSWVNEDEEHEFVDAEGNPIEYERSKEGDLIVEIDPGTAFGTGAHETTKLCLNELKKYIKKEDAPCVLDVGCGSGILSIVSILLGAKEAVGTDIDPAAMDAAAFNSKANNVEEGRITVHLGNVLSEEELCKKLGDEKYDIVVANILADVIIPLTEIVHRFMKKEGYYIISGIINMKHDEVKAAIIENTHLTIVSEDTMGEWVSFVVKRTN